MDRGPKEGAGAEMEELKQLIVKLSRNVEELTWRLDQRDGSAGIDAGED